MGFGECQVPRVGHVEGEIPLTAILKLHDLGLQTLNHLQLLI